MDTHIKVLKSLTVLYAEDDQVIRESISRILEIFFGKVVVAKDGMEAIQLFESNNISVVVLDYVMPFLDGYDVAKHIRNINKTIPIVIASAYTDQEKLLKVMNLNLISYLEKPILKKALLEVLEKVVKTLKQNNLLVVKIDEKYSYNYITKTAYDQHNQEISLSKNEVDFLEMLLSNPNFLFTKQMIEDRIFQAQTEENTLRNMIYRLRKKIDTEVIVTVKDLGYLFKKHF